MVTTPTALTPLIAAMRAEMSTVPMASPPGSGPIHLYMAS